MTDKTDTRARKYKQAAITYFVYGLIYFVGAIYLAQMSVAVRGMSAGDGWALYAIGLAFILIVPPLLWRGFKWFARLIAALLAIRLIGLTQVILTESGRTIPLPSGGDMPMLYGAMVFLLAAAAAAYMVARAAWNWK